MRGKNRAASDAAGLRLPPESKSFKHATPCAVESALAAWIVDEQPLSFGRSYPCQSRETHSPSGSRDH